MEKKYVFEVDDDIKIVIEREGIDIDAGYFYYYLNESVWVGQTKYDLRICSFKDSIALFKDHMMEALQGNLQLDKSLHGKDLSFLYNQDIYEFCQEKEFLSEDPVVYNQEGEWVGQKHLMWHGANGNPITTWLYNLVDGSIVFEGGPYWPESFCKEFLDEQAFFAWMKNYKPLFSRKLPKETLQSWIKTSEELLHDHELVEQANAILI